MTMETGKPLSESIGEVNYATSFLDFYAGELLRPTGMGGGTLYPSTFASSSGAPRGRLLSVQEAIGVTAMITPWNFPLAMITRKVCVYDFLSSREAVSWIHCILVIIRFVCSFVLR